MRQAFETENPVKNRLEIDVIGGLHTCLKQLITALPSGGNARACKRLLEANCSALLRGEHPEKLIRRIGRKRNLKAVCLDALSQEEAQKNTVEIKQLRKLANARPLVPGSRKLERYHSEIISLSTAKASCRDIKLWLFMKKGLVVSHHSIQRYLNAISST
ncbi:MAG TPA: hypothetical protein VHE99_01750 [Gammaproteobacteria bacterium]|nr:hypothetical protein [Gammaproteobacteria bacterium]